MELQQKAYNVAHKPGDIGYITRIVQCAGEACTRTIVEYGSGERETRHAGGLPGSVLEAARDLGKPVVQALCDHHGGEPYPAQPVAA